MIPLAYKSDNVFLVNSSEQRRAAFSTLLDSVLKDYTLESAMAQFPALYSHQFIYPESIELVKSVLEGSALWDVSTANNTYLCDEIYPLIFDAPNAFQDRVYGKEIDGIIYHANSILGHNMPLHYSVYEGDSRNASIIDIFCGMFYYLPDVNDFSGFFYEAAKWNETQSKNTAVEVYDNPSVGLRTKKRGRVNLGLDPITSDEYVEKARALYALAFQTKGKGDFTALASTGMEHNDLIELLHPRYDLRFLQMLDPLGVC